MGNAVNVPKKQSAGAAGNVILTDGTIHRFDKSLTVAELMLEHPQQVVVEFQPVSSGKKPIPLPADKELEMGKVYVMLPIKRGKPANLSSEEARRLLMTANSIVKSKSFAASYTGFLPFVSAVRGRVFSGGVISEGQRRRAGNEELLPEGKMRSMMDKEEDEKKASELQDVFAEILEGRPEYLSRQLSGKGWKPSLDTIKEKGLKKKKVMHGLF